MIAFKNFLKTYRKIFLPNPKTRKKKKMRSINFFCSMILLFCHI